MAQRKVAVKSVKVAKAVKVISKVELQRQYEGVARKANQLEKLVEGLEKSNDTILSEFTKLQEEYEKLSQAAMKLNEINNFTRNLIISNAQIVGAFNKLNTNTQAAVLNLPWYAGRRKILSMLKDTLNSNLKFVEKYTDNPVHQAHELDAQRMETEREVRNDIAKG